MGHYQDYQWEHNGSFVMTGERYKGAKRIFEELMARNSHLMEDMNLHTPRNSMKSKWVKVKEIHSEKQ